MTTNDQDPWLLTPGPLTTSRQTKKAMLHDWGSRDATFIATNTRIRERLLEIAEASETHVCVPLQGSGTFVVEAAIGTLVPRGGKALVLINGAYGTRMTKILDYLGRAYTTIETPEDVPPCVEDVEACFAEDPHITHVMIIHCETTSGMLNPVEAVAEVTARHGRRLIIDAMSCFGAVRLSAKEVQFDAVMASSNKCLEGVPGMGFALIRREALEAAAGNAHSLSLDLHDQWVSMEKNAQWRFTPPIHVIVAFDAAMEQFFQAGGVAGRNKRYSDNCRILVDGMREMGFETLLDDNLQAPIIVTFRMPADPKFDFQAFYDSLKEKGYIIYPGKLTVAPTFRIGCIGDLHEEQMRSALEAIRETISEMGVTTGAPAKAA